MSGLGLLGVALTAMACAEEPKAPPETIRSVKTHVIHEPSNGTVRSFSGLVQAAEVSELAFQVSGRLLHVAVELGDRVTRGQVLASLDRTPFQLRLQSARADLQKARAQQTETRSRFQRVRSLLASGIASQAEFDRAEADLRSSQSSVASATASLELAQRDLDHTVLEAPIDGSIAQRNIEPFQEIPAGKIAFVLHSEEGREVKVFVPDAFLPRISLGQPVSVAITSPMDESRVYEGRVARVGSSAVQANAFPVEIALEADPSALRPGVAAEATFIFRSEGGDSAYLIPLNAVLPVPGSDPSSPILERELQVFVYDSDAGAVRLRRVRAIGLAGSQAEIGEGLSEGDIVVTAGVHFLVDGQKVRLLDESAR